MIEGKRSEGTNHPTPNPIRRQKSKAQAHRAPKPHASPQASIKTKHDQLPTKGAKRWSRSLTLWMAGLQHIIALASGGFIGRIKPGVSYRRDPLGQTLAKLRVDRNRLGRYMKIAAS